ncbi:MAG: hypothetical protein ACK5JF_12860 [Oscillospiraceae bacterium]
MDDLQTKKYMGVSQTNTNLRLPKQIKSIKTGHNSDKKAKRHNTCIKIGANLVNTM